MSINLSIVIPTYNEEKRILRTLKAYTSFFDKKLNCEYIISDQSKDSTRRIVKDFMKKHPNVHLLCLPGKGKGGAVLEAFKRSKGEHVGFTDADNATSPQEFYKLYKFLEKYDAVVGSRGLDDSNVYYNNRTPYRKLSAHLLGLINRHMFGLKIIDTQCGAKIFEKEKMLKIIPKMKVTNSVFDVELLWRFSKVGTIKEIPIKWVDDEFSNFKWHEVIGEFVYLIRIRLGF